MVTAIFLALVASGLGSAASMGLLRRLGVMDVPNTRSSHREPIVRGVGLGVVCGCVIGVLATQAVGSSLAWSWRTTSVLIVASLGAGAIGLVDDVRGGVSFRLRLLAQVIVAFAAVMALGLDGIALPPRPVFLGGAMFFIVAYVNAFNFMDGIDGISALTGVATGGAFAVTGRLEGVLMLQAGGAALAAACLGFLPFNFPSAFAFLGDVGSYFIGAWIALLAVVAARSGVRLDVVLAPLVLYVADVGFTLGTRVLKGEAWHAAHCDHVYQRLSAGVLGQTRTTMLVLAVTVSLCVFGLVVLRAPAWRPVAWPSMMILILAYLTAPLLLGRRPGDDIGRTIGASGQDATQSGRSPRDAGAP